jgi:LacI family transcriptional regulator
MAKLPRKLRVALLVAGWNQYGRGIIEGVWQHAENNHWILEMQPSGPDGSTQIPEGWKGDGIVATVHSRELASRLATYRVPVVNVSGARLQGVNFPRVASNAQAVVDIAVRHLLEKQLPRVAFCGEPHKAFLDFWTQAYLTIAARHGLTPIVYTPSKRLPAGAGLEAQSKDRARWLSDLPKPIGIIGWDTITCRHVASACELAGIEIPEQVAVISLSTEDLLGRTLHPPLSGVDIPVQRIGYEAAKLLGNLMRGTGSKTTELLLEPLGITTRQSTDLFACDDPKVRQVMRFIKENASRGIQVGDVMRAVPIARRTLERRFKTMLGHSPAEEIRRKKIEKVRRLLTDTDMAVPEIADACGFAYAEHMIPLFAKYHQDTPAAFRRNLRARSTLRSAGPALA